MALPLGLQAVTSLCPIRDDDQDDRRRDADQPDVLDVPPAYRRSSTPLRIVPAACWSFLFACIFMHWRDLRLSGRAFSGAISRRREASNELRQTGSQVDLQSFFDLDTLRLLQFLHHVSGRLDPTLHNY